MIVVSKSRQQGLALITVLMILAIMVTIAATMSGRLTLSLQRTEGISLAQKVYWYGQAMAELGKLTLNDDIANSEVISLDQIWASAESSYDLDGGNLTQVIKDFRSCFNVNAIALKAQGNNRDRGVNQFKTLLEAIGLNDYSAQMIAQSSRDWIDNNTRSDSSLGAEDSFYQGRQVAHLAANNLMVDISELRAVQGVDREAYEKIVPYLCAIPSTEQRINVNTVSKDQPEILYALFKVDHDLSIEDIKTLLQARPVSGWDSVSDFLGSSLFAQLTIAAPLKKQLSVNSDFFQLNGAVAFAERLLAVNILYQIKDKQAKMIRYQAGGLHEL